VDPATKQDLADLKTEILHAVAQSKERLTGRMRDMQTELRAFLPFREEVQVRHSTLETRTSAIDARMGVLERRLSEIEKKLLLNPPAA